MNAEKIMQRLLKKLAEQCALGKITEPVEQVSGGFMHRMYKIVTERGVFAVKHLNKEVMSRPDVFENYSRAEKLESILEENNIPIVPALVFNGKKMQCVEENYFYVFNWLDGKISDWKNISAQQCTLAGNILGNIHAIDVEKNNCIIQPNTPLESRINFHEYTKTALENKSEIAPLLEQNESMLEYAQVELNKARFNLPDISCISNEDMDPKNIMWKNGEPFVIDLECLDYGNPVSHVLQLSLQWAGITTCSLDEKKVESFFDGYFKAYDNGFRNYSSVFGLAYTWIEWLEYNIRRSLEDSFDETEKQTGISQVKMTIDRIKYIYDNEQKIKSVFEKRI